MTSSERRTVKGKSWLGASQRWADRRAHCPITALAVQCLRIDRVAERQTQADVLAALVHPTVPEPGRHQVGPYRALLQGVPNLHYAVQADGRGL